MRDGVAGGGMPGIRDLILTGGAMKSVGKIFMRLLANRWGAGVCAFTLVMLATAWYYVQVCVPLRMRIHAERPFSLQVFYQTAERQDYVESRSVEYLVDKGAWNKEVAIPAECVKALRLDFGSAPGTVRILGCEIGGEQVPDWESWTFSPDIQEHVSGPGGRELLIRSDRDDPFMLVRLPDSVPGRWHVCFEKMAQPFALALVLSILVAFAVPAPVKRDEGTSSRPAEPLADGGTALLHPGRVLLGGLVFAVAILLASLYYVQRGVAFDVTVGSQSTFQMQTFFREAGEGAFWESKSVVQMVRAGGETVRVFMPVEQVSALRICFGDAPGWVWISGMKWARAAAAVPKFDKWEFSPEIDSHSVAANGRSAEFHSQRYRPSMSVQLAEPVPARRHVNLKRLAQSLVCAFALAFFVAWLAGTWRDGDCRRGRPFPYMAAVCLGFALLFLWWIGYRTAFVGMDMACHTRIADAISASSLLQHPLDFWMQNFYPLWHLLAKTVHVALRCGAREAAGIVNGSCQAAVMLCLYLYLRRRCGEADARELVVFSLAVCVSGCIYGPGTHVSLLFTETGNSWHNPTSLMVKVMSFPCLLYIADRFDKAIASGFREAITWKGGVLLAAGLVLANLAKPSFMQVYVPAMALVCTGLLIRDRRAAKLCLQIALASLPACLMLVPQYLLAFGSGGEGEGIGWGFMKVWGAVSFPMVYFAYGLAFPVLAFVIAIRRRTVGMLDVLSWTMFLVGLVMRMFLYEKGPRMFHGNLGWGYVLALFFVWVAGIRQYVVLSAVRRDRLERAAYFILTILLMAHVLSGLYKVHCLMSMGYKM